MGFVSAIRALTDQRPMPIVWWPRFVRVLSSERMICRRFGVDGCAFTVWENDA